MDNLFNELKKETKDAMKELASETKDAVKELASETQAARTRIANVRDKMYDNVKKSTEETVSSADEFVNNTKERIEKIRQDQEDDGYVKKKKDMVFQSGESLQQVVNVVNEAAMALNDENRTIRESAIPEVLGGALGAGVGGVGSFAALYGLGTVGLSAAGITSGLATAGAIVGGGMVAGIFVLAAPIAALSAGGVAVASSAKRKQLKQEKERLYKEALIKHEAIIHALESESKANKERMEYLQSLNILLQRAIKDLQKDLGIEAA